jgi:alpha/beta superfamily hydrolase
MQKIAYIIPGNGESHKRQKGYDKVAEFFKERGITPIHVEISWNVKKPHQFEYWKAQFLKKYKRPKNAKVYVFGFSFGAVIAFLAEPKTRPDNLILCSLSPYFVEDQPKLPAAWLKWYKKNIQGSDYEFKKLAPHIRTKTILIMGDKEPSVVGIRARAAKKMIKKSSLVVAKGAKHRISQKEYLDGVRKVIEKL